MKASAGWGTKYLEFVLIFGLPSLLAILSILLARDLVFFLSFAPSIGTPTLFLYLFFLIVVPLIFGVLLNQWVQAGFEEFAPEHPKAFLRKFTNLYQSVYLGYGIVVVVYLVTTNPQAIPFFNVFGSDSTSIIVTFSAIFAESILLMIMPILLSRRDRTGIAKLSFVSLLDHESEVPCLGQGLKALNSTLRSKKSAIRIKQDNSIELYLRFSSEKTCPSVLGLLDAYYKQDPEKIIDAVVQASGKKPEEIFELVNLRKRVLKKLPFLLSIVSGLYGLFPVYWPVLKFLIHWP